jgi:hypothetical protein
MVRGLPEPADACDRPIFMLCTGRSGSTLLRFLLDAHPDLACPPETRLPWLCTQLASAWSVIEDAPMPSGKPGLVPEPVIHGLRQSLTPMMKSYLARRGKKQYCDKSLGGAQHAGLLRQVWPGALFICLYRHPMDVIGSGIEASPWGLGNYGFESYVAASPGNIVAALARYWADYTGTILAAEAELGEDCLPVRYEDLVADPEGQAERLFEFIGVAQVPGITERCFTTERQRFGPGDYKIWNTTGVTTSSVGRGWQVPARLIAPELLAVVNDAAGQLGYVQVDETWGVGSPPADLRVPVDTSDRTPIPAGPVTGAAPTSALLADLVQAGLLNLGEEFTRAWKSCTAESVLLFATAAEPGGSTAWWRLDLGGGTAKTGAGDRAMDTDWSVTGSADAWQRVLTGDLNLSVAFRGGGLRYADKGDHGAGSADANLRVAMIADLLGITRWQPADTGPAPSRLAG